MTRVIAICGTMGSGKSTVVDHLVAALPDCHPVSEDDYNRTTDRSLSDIEAWWKRGADVGEFDLSDLLRHLATTSPDRIPPELDGTAASESASPRQRNQKLILLETQFGRLHPALRPWIDFQCWIDIPADIAVVRKIAQLSTQFRMQEIHAPPGEGLAWIAGFCNGYLSTTQKLFAMQRERVRELSDLSLDGRASPPDVCAELLQRLPQHYLPL